MPVSPGSLPAAGGGLCIPALPPPPGPWTLLDTAVHCSTLYTASTLYTTLYTVQCTRTTLYTVHCSLYTVHCTLYTASTLYTKLYTVHCTLADKSDDFRAVSWRTRTCLVSHPALLQTFELLQ